MRAFLRERDGDLCCHCGLVMGFDMEIRHHPASATIEHLHPKVFGGTNDPSNLALAHKECNLAMSPTTEAVEAFRFWRNEP